MKIKLKNLFNAFKITTLMIYVNILVQTLSKKTAKFSVKFKNILYIASHFYKNYDGVSKLGKLCMSISFISLVGRGCNRPSFRGAVTRSVRRLILNDIILTLWNKI